MPEKFRVTSGAVVFTKDEESGVYKFLVVQRAKDDHFPLHWEFPRGSCEKNEVVANCMMREVGEESGLNVVPVKYLGKTEYFSEKHSMITKCFIFLARAKNQNIKMNANGVHEHEDGKWMVPEVVREMVLPDQRIFIDKALDYLKADHTFQVSDASKKPQVVREQTIDDITYEVYCEMLNFIEGHTYLTEDDFMKILKQKQKNISQDWLSIFKNFKSGLLKIANDFKINASELISAIKNRSLYGVLKAFGFNIALMFRAVGEASKALKGGLHTIFKELYQTKIVQKVRKGVIKVDEFLNRYPKLKKAGGLIVAGLLLYLWLNMTFIGDLDYDFNFTNTVEALKGNFSLADLFVSSEGLMLITLFGTGAAFGLSMPWLGRAAYNLLLALVYTSYYRYIKPDQRKFNENLKKLKSRIGLGKVV